MRRLVTRTVTAFVAILGIAGTSHAQGVAAPGRPPRPATDSIFERARRLVGEGNGAAGRALVDSVLRAATEGTPAYGDALYWRGVLAETADEAEHEYRRVIVEYPLSAYADEALLSLAELEQVRGDRAAALDHLQRFVREHPESPARARAGLTAARLAFEQRDLTRGCAMVAEARASVAAGDVELRNQIDYYAPRCAGANVANAPKAAAAASAPSSTAQVRATSPTRRPEETRAPSPALSRAATADAPRSSAPRETPARETSARETSARETSARETSARETSTRETSASRASTPEPAARSTSGAPRRGIWTIQLAAYNTRADAERLVRKLAARGVKARVSGTTKPFRVRLDYYPTRQAAAAEVAALKRQGIIGFVTDEPLAADARHR